LVSAAIGYISNWQLLILRQMGQCVVKVSKGRQFKPAETKVLARYGAPPAFWCSDEVVAALEDDRSHVFSKEMCGITGYVLDRRMEDEDRLVP
jgi:hypothetical protein